MLKPNSQYNTILKFRSPTSNTKANVAAIAGRGTVSAATRKKLRHTGLEAQNLPSEPQAQTRLGKRKRRSRHKLITWLEHKLLSKYNAASEDDSEVSSSHVNPEPDPASVPVPTLAMPRLQVAGSESRNRDKRNVEAWKTERQKRTVYGTSTQYLRQFKIPVVNKPYYILSIKHHDKKSLPRLTRPPSRLLRKGNYSRSLESLFHFAEDQSIGVQPVESSPQFREAKALQENLTIPRKRALMAGIQPNIESSTRYRTTRTETHNNSRNARKRWLSM